MSDNKYAWGDEEEVVAQTTAEQTPTALSQPEEQPINIEEVLNAPKEAITAYSEQAQANENTEDELDAGNVSLEHLHDLWLHIIDNHHQVSQETRATALELAPTLTLESAGEYTSVPSTVQGKETEQAINKEIMRQGTEHLKRTIKESLATIYRITGCESVANLVEKNNAELAKLYGKAIHQETAQEHLQNAAARVIAEIMKYYQQANLDIFQATRDPELMSHLGTRLEQFKPFMEDDAPPIWRLCRLLASYTDEEKSMAKAASNASFSFGNALQFVADFGSFDGCTGFGELENRCGFYNNRFDESLDNLGRALVDLLNFINIDLYETSDRSKVVELMCSADEKLRIYRGSQGLTANTSSHSGINEIVTRCMTSLQKSLKDIGGEGAAIEANLINLVLNHRYSRLEDVMIKMLTGMNRNLESLLTYADFYENVLVKNIEAHWGSDDEPFDDKLRGMAYFKLVTVATETMRSLIKSIRIDCETYHFLHIYRTGVVMGTQAIFSAIEEPLKALAADFDTKEFASIHRAIEHLRSVIQGAKVTVTE